MALALAVFGASERVAQALDGAGNLKVEIEQGLLTIEAHNAPLGEILTAIGDQAGFTLFMNGEVNAPISISLDGVPVAQGVRQLLGSASSLLIYGPSKGQLAEVHVRAVSQSAGAADDRTSPARRSAETDRSSYPLWLAVTPEDTRDDRLAFVRTAARAPNAAFTDTLATLLAEDRDPLIRRLAASALVNLGESQIGETLAAALADRDRQVRRLAARGLGELGGEQAIEDLARVLIEDSAPDVRRVAALTLSRMKDEAALVALEAGRFDRDSTVRNISETALTRAED